MYSPFLIIFFVVVALAALCCGSSRLGTTFVPGKAIYLFRVLFPSWKFFDSPMAMPTIYVRLRGDTEEFGPWKAVLRTAPPVHWSNIFLNTEGNLHLAYNTLIQQLWHDMNEWSEEQNGSFESSVSFRLTKNLVEQEIRKRSAGGGDLRLPIHYQFKLVAVEPFSGAEEDLMLSREFGLDEFMEGTGMELV